MLFRSGLKDSNGTVTTAAFTSESANINALNMGNASPAQPDEILHSGAQFRTWGDWTFNITGIPYARYSLVFYQTAAAAHGAQATSLTGGPTFYHSQTHSGSAVGYVDNNSTTPYTYTQVTSTNSASPTVDGNYIVFSGLTGPSKTVTIPGGFNIINAFSAFQIVDTPINTTDFRIVQTLTNTTGVFTYTRPVDSSVTYTVWTSTDLITWTRDLGATQGTVTTAGGIETVTMAISPSLLTSPTLFVRVKVQ